MKTTKVILDLTAEEIDALQLAVEYSKKTILESRDNPPELKTKKLAVLDSLSKKVPRSTPIED